MGQREREKNRGKNSQGSQPGIVGRLPVYELVADVKNVFISRRRGPQLASDCQWFGPMGCGTAI